MVYELNSSVVRLGPRACLLLFDLVEAILLGRNLVQFNKHVVLSLNRRLLDMIILDQVLDRNLLKLEDRLFNDWSIGVVVFGHETFTIRNGHQQLAVHGIFVLATSHTLVILFRVNTMLFWDLERNSRFRIIP